MMADDQDTPSTSAPMSSPSQDYYGVLGLTSGATDKQIQAAYKKLSLRYHPDRNPDDEQAGAVHQQVTEAYHVLGDPERRSQYDITVLGLDSNNVQEKSASHEKADVEATETTEKGINPVPLTMELGKAFGRALQRLSFSSGNVSQEILDAAQQIALNGDLDSLAPPVDPRLSDLPFGWSCDAKVDRQQATYYRLTLDDRIIENGFFIRCRGLNKGRFRLLILDKQGQIVLQEESRRGLFDKSATEVVLFFTTFKTFDFADPMHPVPLQSPAISEESVTEFGVAPPYEKDPSPVLQRVRHFVPCNKQLPSGQYLVCIIGENVIGKSAVSVLVAQSNNQLAEATELVNIDTAIYNSRQTVDALKSEYLQAKAAFELATKKINAEGERIDGLILSREAAYRGFLDKSANDYSPDAAPAMGGMLASFTAVAASVASSALSAAAEMSGLQGRNSMGSEHDKEEKEGSNATPLEDPNAGQTSSAAQAVNFLLSNSKSAVSTATSTAASTAQVASGWFKRLSQTATAFAKPPTPSGEHKNDLKAEMSTPGDSAVFGQPVAATSSSSAADDLTVEDVSPPADVQADPELEQEEV